MIEIEPTVENIREGDIVTIETGPPDEPGHTRSVYRVEGAPVSTGGIALATVRARARGGYHRITRITRITRPAPPIPIEPGERFWARWRSEDPEEYIVTYGNQIVDLSNGEPWKRDLFEREHTVVPAPESETVPVPADLIREAEEWDAGDWRVRSGGESILGLIVRAIREARKEKSDD